MVSSQLFTLHLTLCTSSLLGGYLLFAGVRGAELNLSFLGLTLFAFGLLFDAAANKRAEAAVGNFRFLQDESKSTDWLLTGN